MGIPTRDMCSPAHGALVAIAVMCFTGQFAIADANIITNNIKSGGIISDANIKNGTAKIIEDANVTEDEWVKSVQELQEPDAPTNQTASHAERRSGVSNVMPYDCTPQTPPLQMVSKTRNCRGIHDTDRCWNEETNIKWFLNKLQIETGKYQTADPPALVPAPTTSSTDQFLLDQFRELNGALWPTAISKLSGASINPIDNKVYAIASKEMYPQCHMWYM